MSLTPGSLVLVPNEPLPAVTITIVENWPSLLVKK